jgi:16S rRNA (cytosine967-C5)-methyltransferase
VPVSPARAAAFDILMRVEQTDAFAADLLHSSRLDRLSPADRALCTEIAMGVLRWRSALDEALAQHSSQRLERLDLEVRTALRIAAYQLGYLERVPVQAAVNESVELVKRARKRSAAAYVNAVLRKMRTARQRTGAKGDSPDEIARLLAHPKWLVTRWAGEYGLEVARRICEWDQTRPATAVRLPSHAEPRQQVLRELQDGGIELSPGALLGSARIVCKGDVTKSAAFRERRIHVQDEVSQLVALLVGRGQRILDCCAAPGGKTAAIAEHNPGSAVLAVDVHEHRARLVRRLVPAANVSVIAADAVHLPVASNFDRVLADVPCSGTGTLARNPDIKWRLRTDDLGDLQRRQIAILTAALEQLSPGGKLVYSTCSLEREENEAIVERVLGSRADVRLLNCAEELKELRASGELAWSDISSLTRGHFLRTIPGVHPCDGFFAAVLQRRA